MRIRNCKKLGLHAIPPGQHDYAIVANAITSKIGKKSSAADLTVLQTGKATVKRDDAGKFFDLCLPIADSSGRPVGMTVMEIPFSFAKGADNALAKAAAVRDRLQIQYRQPGSNCLRRLIRRRSRSTPSRFPPE